tara:strand:+ start:2568 stop:2720 length:153 start_codon:yes stop_codon:yes gene_type:complete
MDKNKKIPIRRQHVGVGFFGLAHAEKKEKALLAKKQKEIKNGKSRHKSSS